MFWRACIAPSWSLRLALAAGSTLITGVAYFSAQSPSPLVFFYLWVFLYSAYFFTTREMAAQIVYVGLAFAALLAARPPSAGVPAWWLVGMGTLLVAAILIRSMRERADLLIASLYDAARTDLLTKLPNRRGFRELPARSICDKSQPPKISPFGFTSAGIAITRTRGRLCGSGIRAISRAEPDFIIPPASGIHERHRRGTVTIGMAYIYRTLCWRPR